MRNYDEEAKLVVDSSFDNTGEGKKYSYEFDGIVRSYMMKTFMPYFSPGPALEIGCHHGDLTVVLENFFDDLSVVEPSRESMEIARKRTGADVKYFNTTVEEYSTTDKYNAIFLINSLEHVEDSVGVLKKAKSLLSPMGRIYMLVPNANSPSRQMAVFMGLIDTNNSITEAEHAHGHRRTYSFDTLAKDLLEADIEVQNMGGILFKGLANYQMDLALEKGIISMEYIEASYKLGFVYPQLCASLFCVSAQ